MTDDMTDASRPDSADEPLALRPNDLLGPSVPDEVMLYVHAYGDSRADDDGLSALRIGEAVLALRRWAAQLQAAERERWASICDAERAEFSEQAARNDGRQSDFAFGSVNSSERIKAAGLKA